MPSSSAAVAEQMLMHQRQLGQLHHVQSDGSLSSAGSNLSAGVDGSSGESATEDDSEGNGVDGGEPACSITLIERLIRSHPIWFLPGIQRAGAFHLLQGKEEGNFVVRQSSQSDTMALSVRLPAGKGPYIEHYLIQANKGKLSLETSENRFDNIPSLIAHYSQCCDELPVQLTLPRAMREAKNRQQLSSLALLGQEFWRYPMANPKGPPDSTGSSNTSSLGSFRAGKNNNNNGSSTPSTESIILNLTPISSKDSATMSPASNHSTTSTFNPALPRQPRPTPPNTLNLTTFNEPMNRRPLPKLSPNDKLCQRLISPNLVQSLVQRSPSPLVHNVDANVLSPGSVGSDSFGHNNSSSSSGSGSSNNSHSNASSATSNFHRNIASSFHKMSSPTIVQTPGGQMKSPPPPPPPRWAKPTQQQQQQQQQKSSSFIATTTINVNQSDDQSTPSESNTPSLMSPQSASNKSLASNKSSSAHSSGHSPLTPNLSSSSSTKHTTSNGSGRQSHILSPNTPSPGATKSSSSSSRRRKEQRDARKNSQHYRESDILDSYYRSSPADKASDYEDIWNSTDQSNPPTWSTKEAISKSYNEENSSKIKSETKDKLLTPVEKVRNLEQGSDKLIIRNDKVNANEKMSYKEITSPEFSSFKPLQESKISHESTPTPDDNNAIGKRPDLLSRVCSANSLNSPTCLTPPRNKFGLAVLTRSENNSPMAPELKQASPFYAEPADAIPRPTLGQVTRRRPKPLNAVASKFRHSEPGWLQTQLSMNCNLGNNGLHPIDWDDSEEAEDKTPLISSSVDNLAKRLSGKDQKKCLPCQAKPVQPPRIKHKIFSDTSWAVDSSWEFIGNDADGCEPDYDCDPDYDLDNSNKKFADNEHEERVLRNALTARSIILQRYPELLKSPDNGTSVSSDRNSSYDNVEKRQIAGSTSTMTTTTTTLTNSTLTMDQQKKNNSNHDERDTYQRSESEMIQDQEDRNFERNKRNRSFRIDTLMGPPKFRAITNRDHSDAGAAVRSYAFQLAADSTTTFSQNIENFIKCTREGKEESPHVVMRNMRQFMSGMKNYLVKHGEREFEKEVEKERLKLKANEFLNLDAILEDVMIRLVVRPLREHVYDLFVKHYAENGSLKTLAENLRQAQNQSLHDLGASPKILPPSAESLDNILKYFEKLQYVDSPLEKLDYLLDAIYAIHNAVKHANAGRSVTLAADDLLPIVVWVLIQGKIFDAEIEAEFMWGLIHQSLLTGEGGYYLTTFSSAVQFLKTFKPSQGTTSSFSPGCGVPDCSCVLKVLVPDELHGSLITRTLPARPNMNTRDVCRILAHQMRCTNPQDYGLFKLSFGEDTLLWDHQRPQDLTDCMLVYKRIDAKIAWPRATDVNQCKITDS
ncbi:hypothetical protein TKK_0001323 [Trichogramma kaykai]